ncbi:uncharacterized protein K452DRAFT_148688 [Aplosporella prunicola CBS 121167]|uniref:Zn(2)-C6 fungal-type domain-containing protein n=1 Tax=Aplosporella prunicola CBS 121167 TaxID=1176127 RepID=A0A6A6AZ38_9PEZI|nr:uncharacterized protein K452DRAFT_148688 [Aplosporella prunicola CBS 121167]KAF2136047.1 hypothetical protein K452DRAFT_148688 [Aplosporella prunicola CBS 121167]
MEITSSRTTTARACRSRSGCAYCKARKRRCGEELPACQACRKRGLKCVYPSRDPTDRVYQYQISQGRGYHFVPIDKRSSCQLLNVTDRDVARFSDRYFDDSNGDIDAEPPPRPRLGGTTRLLTFPEINDVQNQLLQYYTEVMCKCRVFEDGACNPFRSIILPLCYGSNRSLNAVLALSANDRRTAAASAVDYTRLSLQYKNKVLKELFDSVSRADCANENVIICLLLCSLEIADEIQPVWVRHMQGAYAIMDSFSSFINNDIRSFALSYFEPRRTYLLTAGSEILMENQSHSAEISGDLMHMGCSPQVVDVVAQITRLANTKREHRQSGNSSANFEVWSYERGLAIRARLDSISHQGSSYLVSCAECFKIAAQMYLRHVIFDAPLGSTELQNLLQQFFHQFAEIRYEARTLFPMWPLFLAGCMSTTDEERKTVLRYFETVAVFWPVSNVPRVRESVEAVWKARDLGSGTRDSLDWQKAIDRLGWKLALS